MKTLVVATILALSSLSTGCTYNQGQYGPNSHFSYPNSNVVPLRQVKASTSKISLIIFPSFDDAEIIQLVQDALAQQPGADLLLNFTLDTKTISYIILTKTDITIEGTAAKMNVGMQELKNFYENVKYKSKGLR